MSPQPRSQSRAIGYGLAAVALWSTVATAFKWSLGYLTPATLVLVAVATSWLLLLTTVAATGRLAELREWRPQQWLITTAAGIINPAAYYWVLFAAYARLPAQEAMAINYTWAITLGLLAVPLLGQTLPRAELAAALVAYTGVLWIATRGAPLELELASPEGIALALLSTVLWAAYWLIGAGRREDPLLSLLVNFSAALPLVAGLAWLASPGADPSTPVPLAGVLGGVYIGVFEMGVAFMLWLAAMRAAEHTLGVSALIFLSPPLSLVLISEVLGEPILPSTFTGLALILAGLAGHQWLAYRSRASGKSTDTDLTSA